MKALFLLLSGVLLSVMACTNAASTAVVDVAKAKSLLADPAGQLQVVDLRTPPEVAATGTLPGAIAINFRSADFAAQIEKLDKKRPVLVYCAAGSRSAQATQVFQQAGFSTIYDMSPGMSGWLAAGEQTSNPN